MPTIKIEPLTKESFAPFGDLIQVEGSEWFPINNGTTERYHKLALVETPESDAQAGISIFRGSAFHLPIEIKMLERHPLGSQAFIPLNSADYIVVVAPPTDTNTPDEGLIRAFYAKGNQGVNYRLGTWHHPLLSLDKIGDFVVVDRIGNTKNCDEVDLSQTYQVAGPLPV